MQTSTGFKSKTMRTMCSADIVHCSSATGTHIKYGLDFFLLPTKIPESLHWMDRHATTTIHTYTHLTQRCVNTIKVHSHGNTHSHTCTKAWGSAAVQVSRLGLNCRGHTLITAQVQNIQKTNHTFPFEFTQI